MTTAIAPMPARLRVSNPKALKKGDAILPNETVQEGSPLNGVITDRMFIEGDLYIVVNGRIHPMWDARRVGEPRFLLVDSTI